MLKAKLETDRACRGGPDRSRVQTHGHCQQQLAGQMQFQSFVCKTAPEKREDDAVDQSCAEVWQLRVDRKQKLF